MHVRGKISILSQKQKGGKIQGKGTHTHTIKPLPKPVLDPPTYDTFSPLGCSRPVISLEESGTDQTNPFLRPPILVLEGALSSTFPPQKSHDTFCPPICRFPTQSKKFVHGVGGGVSVFGWGPDVHLSTATATMITDQKIDVPKASARKISQKESHAQKKTKNDDHPSAPKHTSKIPIRANRFEHSCGSLSRPELIFFESRFGGLKIANRRFEAIRANRSHDMKKGSANRFANRPDSHCESPRHWSVKTLLNTNVTDNEKCSEQKIWTHLFILSQLLTSWSLQKERSIKENHSYVFGLMGHKSAATSQTNSGGIMLVEKTVGKIIAMILWNVCQLKVNTW